MLRPGGSRAAREGTQQLCAPTGSNVRGGPVDTSLAPPTLRRMITLTPRAAQQVRTMHAGLGDPQKKLRVFIENGGCSGFQYGMSFDVPKEGDQEFVTEGVPVLMDPTTVVYLSGSSVDFDDGLHGKGFEIKNPNAQSTCGCGKSFN